MSFAANKLAPVFSLALKKSEQTLTCTSGAALLSQLEAQGVSLPYQCRQGYCGGCRTRVLSGEVEYFKPVLAWLNPGEILPCCCKPKSDIQLEL